MSQVQGRQRMRRTAEQARPGRRWRRLTRCGTAVFLPLLALLLLAGPVGAAVTAQTGPTGARAIADAIAGPGSVITDASFVTTTTGTPNGVSNAPLAGFGTAGSSFGILTTGKVSNVAIPNAITNTDNAGTPVTGRGNTAFDISVLRVNLNVPQGANCLTFDFKFLSAEYPGFVQTSYNDAFIAELDQSTWTTSGSTITAPRNFAFDATGKVVSINSTGLGGMSTAQGAGTPFSGTRPYSAYSLGTAAPAGNAGGATGLLRASTQITPGDHSVFFSIFDQGDKIFDSAVFLDNMAVGFVPNPAVNCRPGATPANYKLTLTPETGTAPAGTAHTMTATLTDAETGNPVTEAAIDFTLDGANPGSGTATTNGDGQATFNYTGTAAGTDQIAACYQPAGASACLAQSSATQEWSVASTALAVAPATGTYGGTALLTATLTATDTAAPLAGRTIAFSVNGMAVCGGADQPTCPTTNADGVAELAAANLAGIDAGDYVTGVVASFAGESSYAASDDTAALSIAKATLAVTANDATRTYTAPNPSFGVTFSGFVPGEGLAEARITGKAAITTEAGASSPAGTYAIVPSLGTLAAPNYDFAPFKNGTLTVTQTATQLAQVRGTATYGDKTGTVSATLTTADGTPVAGAQVRFTVDGAAVCGGNTGRACPLTDARGVAELAGVPIPAGLNAGNHANKVCATFAGGGDYTAADQACGQLVVARRILWVKPTDRTIGQGQPNPSLTPPAGCAAQRTATSACWIELANGSGFINGDDWSDVNLANLRFSYSRTGSGPANEKVGAQYRITALGATSTNYDLRYQTGTLTVVAAP